MNNENLKSKNLTEVLDEYSYLDTPQFRKQFTGSEQGAEMRFYVEGLRCSSCLLRVEKLGESLAGVNHIRVDLGQNLATVRLIPGGSFAAVARSLQQMGYKPHAINSASSAYQLQTRKNRQHLIKLGVAAACAGNIMLLQVGLYAGASGPLARVFEWLSFALFLPVLLYSSQPFFINTWNSLKNKRASIDVPIVAAIVVGSALSFYHLVRGIGDIYFDSLAVLVFLLLASRYLLKRIQQTYLSPSYLLPFFSAAKARVWDEEKQSYHLLPSESLRAGQKILVLQNEPLPADGNLTTDVFITTAILTGESEPQLVRSGELGYAGTKLASARAEMIVGQVGENTRIGELLKKTEQEISAKTPLISFTDKIAQAFTVSVLLIGAIFAFTYGLHDTPEAISRALALAILACPCALAFATPLAQSLSLARAVRRGYIVKNAEVLEKISQCTDIIFDKTGTLTYGAHTLLNWHPYEPSAEIKSIILTLELRSKHPIARAFVSELSSQVSPLSTVEDFRETIGVGVQARVGADHYELKSCPQQNKATTVVGVFKNGEMISSAEFGDRLRPEAPHVVNELKRDGFTLHLLSGDAPGPVSHVARTLDISQDQAHYQVSPERKLEYVKSLTRALMIGDGANDSAALASAYLSVAVHGSMESSLRAADVYATIEGLTPVTDLVHLSRGTMQVIKRNLGFSLVYNIGGGVAALMGYIDPLAAAILMPVSSGIVLSSSLIGTKTLRRLGKKTEIKNSISGPAIGATAELQV